MDMNRKNIRTKVSIFLLVICLTFIVTSCGKNGDSSNRGHASVDEARVEFEEMCMNLMEYAKNADGEKVDQLVKCYPDGFDECTYMSIFDDYNINGFPEYLFYVVPLDDKGEYYIGGIINYSTHDDQFEMSSYLLTISFLDGCCKIDCCSEVAELASQPDIYPAGMKDAEENGRFSGRLNENDLSFADENAVINNIFLASTYCIWQNEDGSLDVAVSFKNGTDGIKNVKNMTVSMFTYEGDEIVIHDEYVNTSIDAKSTMDYIVHISAESLNMEVNPEIDYTVFVQYDNE